MPAEGIRCFIGLGSNMGDAEANIKQALKLLANTGGISVASRAPFYRTAPVGYTEQDYFINTVAAIYTTLSPKALLEKLQAIENKLGRVRLIRWGPRTIDLDLLLYGNELIHEPDLEVPHPRMHQRAFVVVPLADICPDLVINGEKVDELARRLSGEQDIYAIVPE
ncbi:2-amino-4-hydroxy-6-hydroxymethyldihydropteridinediphosphokinase [Desulfotomaculum arcticum]|uniref:2-amino-4-hydroxy-6-hydroxymethyldihydropteridine diphosphokinase n=1 Tax=Desulfotruncus arcticus DSM 17038 TaxID=1121424 RepID=A0A1I2WIG6_9FIRM|nr:2-amino-4-hydroxy-6-hydroxymethyldihydropteridine diphosphokinase [Desulfotruncus arcticus]SFH00509.1 2-amino-4-hydroxy-6-hydroxymethyldihydropteridinediphosphokinase [Desulfotomaculum arcticum] [Desulfotruncus arcticus DSM 17038]